MTSEMNFSRLVRSKRAMVITAVGVCAAVTASQVASASASSARETASTGKTCIGYRYLKEVSTETITSFGAHYDDILYDASGNQVGTVSGDAVVYLNSKGQEMEWLDGTGTIPQGTIVGAGAINVASTLAGQTQTFFNVGKSGEVLGMHGEYHFTLISKPDLTHAVYISSFRLCRP
jgi:Allene oxide cyclase barrel like domain